MPSLHTRHLLTLFFALIITGCSTVSPQPKASPATLIATEKSIYHIPKTDCEVRDWYNYQVVAIPVINKRWTQIGLNAAERAKRAFDLRHKARINARFMMPDQSEVKDLQERDTKKYGNPDGPTLTYLVKKLQGKGLKGEPLYNNIIVSSSRTDSTYNAACTKP